MSIDLSAEIREMQQERGISEELVISTIVKMVEDAYEREFGTLENCEVELENESLRVLARKTIVLEEELEDPAVQISLESVVSEVEGCEVGDELLIELNPKDFSQRSVNVGKQRGKQSLREIEKDTIYSEYKEKEGQLIQGYVQRSKDGNLFVDIGRVEGILPRRYQSPRERYERGDRIRVLVWEVRKDSGSVGVVLSRSHTELVERICEIEIPEIAEGIVKIERIVREVGYRTKIAVRSVREDVEPVGACVGPRGIRIQNIVSELDSEKIDVLMYSPDPQSFAKNALSPAQVKDVYLIDSSKKKILAITDESQLALAIGKSGQNVRLANRLVDWNIDVKTEEQAIEEGLLQEAEETANELFNYESEEIENISDLVGLDERVIELLKNNGIELIESLLSFSDEGLRKLEGLTEQDVEMIQTAVRELIVEDGLTEGEVEEESFEDEPVLESEPESEVDEELSEEESDGAEESLEEIVEYHCPECDVVITLEMDSCPGCGIGLSFEEVEEDEG